ncbi:MAG: DNA polymerase III subunit alpha [Alphaproteobacteria bacterium]|nr:DNA polymerase III subunit alpha [Alphaproteobacteria bacterium]MBV9862727.1 DNA polymerase III subunit alpha [Alphaproteobacteria bacterium]
MPLADFVHLRLHTAYSLSAGAIRIKDLVKLCRAEAMPAVAITDTGNLFGALEFATACVESGIQPIIGCEVALARAGDAEIRPGRGPVAPERLVLLVQSETGYRNLLALVSRSYLEGDAAAEPSVGLADLAAASEGLLCLTGGPKGPLGRKLVEGQQEAAEMLLTALNAAFPNRLYLELTRHGTPHEAKAEPGLIDLAYRHGLPLVATNDAYFPDRGFHEAHDALLCIAQGRLLDEAERERLTPDHCFRPAAEMRAVFADLPEACDNTLVIARRCAFIPRPRKPILPAFPTAAGVDEAGELRRAAQAGLEARLEAQVYGPEMNPDAREAAARPYLERLHFELGVIIKMGFAGYFLIVADFIQWAKRQGIPVGPGRGSGAGSVVAWTLTITDLDPLRFGLLFERFLNPERVSMPDFDVDFCQERRDEVIRYVQQKYGRDRVAQIITFGKLQARAVLRDVGRVLAMPYGQVDRLCKLVPNNPAHPVTLEQAIANEPLLQQQRDNDETVARLLAIALKLEGLYRHASTHAAGVVIGDRPLVELVPLYRDPRSDMPVTQFNMKWVESAGLVKFDFLGLKTLDVLQQTVELLKARGVELDLAQLPLDDAKTYSLIARGDTSGIFQLESAGMRDSLRKLKPNRFEDIIAMNALYRPGPMDSIPNYIKCKNGEEEVRYPHPMLEPILKDTFGVFTYQEQVMQAAQVMADYSLGSADLLRRAMGKKIRSEMEAQRATFVSGAAKKGIGDDQANFVFDLMEKFSGYGFNKSHSAPYALVAYQTAYLKANYPVEFLAASMTLDIGNTDKLNQFRQEAGRLGIVLLPPNVNRSEVAFAVETDPRTGSSAIRYALAAVKGVGAQAMTELVAERRARGPFRDLFDFARRIDARSFNRRQFESLIKAGAFECLNPNRAQSFAAAELLLRHASRAAEERESRQENLFAAIDSGFAARPSLPLVQDWPPVERLQNEFDAIGFYLSAHPLDPYGKSLERAGILRFADLPAALAGNAATRFKLAGIVVGRKERTSARGNRFAFVQMSDTSGLFEVTLFSEVLGQARALLDSGRPLVVTVDVRSEEDSLRLTAQKIEPLDDVVAHAAAGLRVFVGEPDALSGLKSLIGREAGGRGRVTVVLDLPSREVEIAIPGGFRVDPRFRAAVKSLPGIVDVHDI